MRAAFVLACVLAGDAAAEVKVPRDPPRWRVRAALLQGAGGAADGPRAVAVFPASLELGARLVGPLSVTVAAHGVLMGAQHLACGEPRRANAAFGTAGLRIDLANGKSASWAAPFFEVHGGVGAQAGREVGGTCSSGGVFGTGGARVGLDAWLGRAAVTVSAAFDYLPRASPISILLGATVILY